MKNNITLTQNNADGFGVFWPLWCSILVGFIIAAVVHLLTAWLAAVLFILVVALIVFFASLPDLMKYIKISSM